jgi:Cobalamin-independent synthase, Catalytic domain
MPPAVRLTLPPATASGVGSLPGTAALEASALTLQTLPGLPYLPELPARGPGADMIGRAFAVLIELYAAVAPSGWRFAEHPGKDTRRAVGYLGEDLDAFEERGQGLAGAVKVQVAGPWTLAASVELHYGDKALADRGACRDIAASLADGLRGHVAEVRKRMPGVETVVVQLDEPLLPAVLRGGVRTASGFGNLAAVEPSVVQTALRSIVDTLADGGVPVVAHCCAADVPIALLHRAGFAGLGLDLTYPPADDPLGEYLEDGGVLLAGIVQSRDATLPPVKVGLEPVRGIWDRLGLPAADLARVIPVTTCGLAGASPSYALAAAKRCAESADLLAEWAEA